MARPQKEGLNYFPLDVDLFEDYKLFDVQEKYGPLGEVIYMRLLCLIYRTHGYYYEFESVERLASMMIKSIGNKWTRGKQAVTQVIPFLAQCGLFSHELYGENVLTSVGIQKRFLKVAGRRQLMNKKYWLLEDNASKGLVKVSNNGGFCNNNGGFCNNNLVNVYNNSTKENKRKENINSSSYIQRREYIKFYSENIGVITPIIVEEAEAFINDGMSDGCIVLALREAVVHNAKNWKYSKAILNRWLSLGITTEEAARAGILEFGNQKVKDTEVHDISEHQYNQSFYNDKKIRDIKAMEDFDG